MEEGRGAEAPGWTSEAGKEGRVGSRLCAEMCDTARGTQRGVSLRNPSNFTPLPAGLPSPTPAGPRGWRRRLARVSLLVLITYHNNPSLARAVLRAAGGSAPSSSSATARPVPLPPPHTTPARGGIWSASRQGSSLGQPPRDREGAGVDHPPLPITEKRNKRRA